MGSLKPLIKYLSIAFGNNIQYDVLCFAVVSKKPVSESSTSQLLQEPLTLDSLQKETPTRNAPGENSFRNGRAQQWIIENATLVK